ncbi:MAG: RCC1 domain-containing protein [Gemmatimonadales bacterium]
MRRWLLCEECVHGELDSLRSPSRRDRVVPMLAKAIRGLSVGQRANLRRQLEETYQQLANRATAQHRALPVTHEGYIGHFLSNYEAVYQSRAVSGLAAIGTPEAQEALREAAEEARDGALIVRGDVLEELSTAISNTVPGGTVAWASISAGPLHTCGIRTDGRSYCWGRNDKGQLGDGTIDIRLRPTLVAGNLTFSSIATGSGGGDHTCGLAADSVYCWGSNGRGQLGNGTTTPRKVPTLVAGDIAFSGVTVGGDHTCAWTAAHQAYCWGDNHAGQVGDGTTADRHQPVASTHGMRLRSMRAGTFHTCADSLNGRLYCWGANGEGQLGDGSTIDRPAPTPAATSLRFKSISMGGLHGCGLIRGGSASVDGLAYCTGQNQDGRLGDGSLIGRDSLVPVKGDHRFLTISAGEGHTCGIVSGTRELRCWGDNSYGQLGDGTSNPRQVPTKVLGSQSYAVVSAGAGHTCAITTLGTAYCWGRNTDGQVGDSTNTDRAIPTEVMTP